MFFMLTVGLVFAVFYKKNILKKTMNASCSFLSNVFNLWNFLTKLELPFHGNNLFNLQTDIYMFMSRKK